ncbi:DUF3054 domain-containing protein [Agromyces protaetiae]|uniref:DUF3054 domain-containing protein n=1 Tax=Agromyces protaetiae TaxID=2509455 RepID=A0A4P6FBT8_9MICO|nr:DUF3054 domain-containing protein [Agromyces protaetiae]QAY72383.1 DUF3054 domain-containing protein [Agromyces protaetiae]
MRRTALLSLALDFVLVVVFAAIGRANHGEAVLPGLFGTVWPFAVALGVAWIALLAWRAPLRPVRTGLPVWAITVAGGLLLRGVTGGGTALPFIIVTAITLGVFLVGWRLIAAAVSRSRAKARAKARANTASPVE